MIACKGYIIWIHCDNSKFEGLTDYKFYCFDGEPKYLYVSKGLENHSTALISFLDMNWEFAPFGRSDYRAFNALPNKPVHFSEMIKIARKLANGFSFIRVDLYEISNCVFFSELTFSPCSGFMPFSPKEWDTRLGDLINISSLAENS